MLGVSSRGVTATRRGVLPPALFPRVESLTPAWVLVSQGAPSEHQLSTDTAHPSAGAVLTAALCRSVPAVAVSPFRSPGRGAQLRTLLGGA